MGKTKTTNEGAEKLKMLYRFLIEKPGVSLFYLCKATGVSYNDWQKISKKERGLTPHYYGDFDKLLKEMKKYGFEE